MKTLFYAALFSVLPGASVFASAYYSEPQSCAQHTKRFKVSFLPGALGFFDLRDGHRVVFRDKEYRPVFDVHCPRAGERPPSIPLVRVLSDGEDWLPLPLGRGGHLKRRVDEAGRHILTYEKSFPIGSLVSVSEDGREISLIEGTAFVRKNWITISCEESGGYSISAQGVNYAQRTLFLTTSDMTGNCTTGNFEIDFPRGGISERIHSRMPRRSDVRGPSSIKGLKGGKRNYRPKEI